MTIIASSEEWRSVVGWPEYEVSDLGRVRRRAPWLRKKNGQIIVCYPRNETLNPSLTEGYPTVTLCKDGKRKNIRVYALVCAAFHGPKPTASHEVAHWDGDRLNSAANNLRWATRLENVSDTKRHGRDNAGERCGAAKLSEQQVCEIIAKLRAGNKQNAIAKAYGVGGAAVSNIKHGKAWRHLYDGFAAQGPFA